MASRQFRPWRRGDPANASRLNEQHLARNQGIVGGRGINVVQGHDSIVIELLEDRIIPVSGSGARLVEVAIHKVVRCNDPADQSEIDNCVATGQVDHFRAYALDSDGIVIFDEPYLPVFPNWEHGINEYAAISWNANDPTQPVFTAFDGGRGLTLIFNEGEKLVDPPTNVCGEDSKGGGVSCCLGPGNCQSYPDDGTCALDGGEEFPTSAACMASSCFGSGGTGACCTGDLVCLPDQTIEGCNSNPAGGTYQGDGSTCTPDPCGGGGATGSCCNLLNMPECLENVGEATCDKQIGVGWIWIEGGACAVDCPASDIGACCFEKVGGCVAGLTAEECGEGNTHYPGQSCDKIQCPL